MAAAKKPKSSKTAPPQAADQAESKPKPPKRASPKATKPKATKPKATKPKATKSPADQAQGKRPAAKPRSQSAADKYADPALRDRLKDEIMKGDKGGKPGQWSARKAQLLATEYKKAGGKYNNDEDHKTKDQQHLDQWTAEDWQTADGKPAEREGGTTRYLPKEAWDKLTPAEQKATDAKKQAGSRSGKQFVGNTAAARQARQDASDESAPPASKPPKGKARATNTNKGNKADKDNKADGKQRTAAAKSAPKAARKPKAKPKSTPKAKRGSKSD